jgi:hypothetical protein
MDRFIGICPLRNKNDLIEGYVISTGAEKQRKRKVKYVSAKKKTPKILLKIRNELFSEHGFPCKGLLKITRADTPSDVQHLIHYHSNYRWTSTLKEEAYVYRMYHLTTRKPFTRAVITRRYPSKALAYAQALTDVVGNRTLYNKIAQEYNILFQMWVMKACKQEQLLGRPLLSAEFKPELWKRACKNIWIIP